MSDNSGVVENVFFSGGFDTTSYILDRLITQEVKIQPIVVKVSEIDGTGMDRPSAYQEEISRQNFYSKFRNKYPELSHNLLEEIVYENTTILDKDTIKIGKHAFKEGIFSREVNQLLYFHQVSKDKNLNYPTIGYQKDDKLTEKDIEFFKKVLKFNIPLVETTKTQMLEKAIENKYDSFLYETWSCWFPQPGNIPCGECALCEITIVDTKLKFPKGTLI